MRSPLLWEWVFFEKAYFISCDPFEWAKAPSLYIHVYIHSNGQCHPYRCGADVSYGIHWRFLANSYLCPLSILYYLPFDISNPISISVHLFSLIIKTSSFFGVVKGLLMAFQILYTVLDYHSIAYYTIFNTMYSPQLFESSLRRSSTSFPIRTSSWMPPSMSSALLWKRMPVPLPLLLLTVIMPLPLLLLFSRLSSLFPLPIVGLSRRRQQQKQNAGE